MPITVVIDGEGEIVTRHLGPMDQGDLNDAIDDASPADARSARDGAARSDQYQPRRPSTAAVADRSSQYGRSVGNTGRTIVSRRTKPHRSSCAPARSTSPCRSTGEDRHHPATATQTIATAGGNHQMGLGPVSAGSDRY